MTTKINYDLCTYTSDEGKTYCGLGRGSHLYADHFFVQGQPESEFDKVFDQMEAPEYPATCDNCGEVGTNASMEQHECDEHDASAAPERGEWRYVETRYSAEVAVNDNLRLRAHWTGTWDRDEIRTLMQGVVTEHNQHSTLIAQRERLIEALREALSYIGVESSGEVQDQIRAVLKETGCEF